MDFVASFAILAFLFCMGGQAAWISDADIGIEDATSTHTGQVGSIDLGLEPSLVPEPVKPLVEPIAPTYFYVNSGRWPELNVRGGPSTRFDVEVQAPYGTPVTRTGKSSTTTSGSTWWEIDVNGIVGWANSKFLTSEPLGGKRFYFQVKSDPYKTLNLRKVASTAFDVLVKIPNGARVEYLGEKANATTDREWFKIRFDRFEGWVAARYRKLL